MKKLHLDDICILLFTISNYQSTNIGEGFYLEILLHMTAADDRPKIRQLIHEVLAPKIWASRVSK